jgi:membrane-associated phospholipid phosphatase
VRPLCGAKHSSRIYIAPTAYGPTSIRTGCDVHSMIAPTAKGASWHSPRRSAKKPMTLPLKLSSLFEPRSRLTCAAAMFNSISSLAVLGALACLSMTTTCRAEDFGAKDVLEDARLYFTAPIRWDEKDWLYFAGALGAIGVAHEYDGDVRKHFAIGDRALLNGQDKNSLRDALPIGAVIAGTWAFAALIGDQPGKVESYTMIEAGAFSLITTEALKFAAGRETPNETTRVDAWRQGGSSFPSLHSSAAFAVGTVLAESGGDDYRWVRRVLGYGMASAIAYERLHENVHWLSDTVAGAAIGIATAQFTMNRRHVRAHRWELSVEPMKGGGTELDVTVNLH